MKLETNKMKLRQAVVMLLASASFLGVSALPATAQQAEFPINVTVDNTVGFCELPPVPAYWDPFLTYGANGGFVDLSLDTSVDFTVDLGLQGEWNECSNIDYLPTGTVSAAFDQLPAELSVDYLDCSSAPWCDAGALWSNAGSFLYGALTVDPNASLGTYRATLMVTWTLD